MGLPVRQRCGQCQGPSPAEGKGPRRGLGRAGTLEDSSTLSKCLYALDFILAFGPFSLKAEEFPEGAGLG